MADLSITAANVKLKGNSKPPIVVQAGETITQGQPVYAKAADSGKYWRCDADTQLEAEGKGVAMTPAVADGYFLMAPPGCLIDLGATLTVGQIYVVSVNAGGISPYSDLASGDFPCIVGIPTAAATVELLMFYTGVAKA